MTAALTDTERKWSRMSEDLIRRSDAIKALDANFTIKGKENTQTVLNYLELVRTRIEGAPTIEPKRGEWAKRTHDTLIAQVNFAYCSECGQPIMHEHTRPLWNFCPNCGCAMTKE